MSSRPARARAASVAALALVSALAVALACGDDASDSERQSSAALELAACELPRGGYVDACNACLAERCCAPIEACKAGDDCAAQLDCMLGCQYATDPPECSRACLAAGRHPDYVAFDDCSFETCREQCWL